MINLNNSGESYFGLKVKCFLLSLLLISLPEDIGQQNDILEVVCRHLL